MKKLLINSLFATLFVSVVFVASEFRCLNRFADAKLIDPSMMNLHGGETLETYAVDHEGKIIGESRFPERIEASGGEVKTYGWEQAISGKRGAWVYRDYGGEWIFGYYTPAKDKGTDKKVAVLSEIDVKEVAFLAGRWSIVAFAASLVFFLLTGRGSSG